MHKLLARQLQKSGIAESDLNEGWKMLIGAVEATYRQTDDDRALLERSMDVVSTELADRYERLQAALAQSLGSQQHLTRVLSVLAATLESDADAVLIVDDHGLIEMANQRLSEIWKLPEPARAGQSEPALLKLLSTRADDPAEFLATARMISSDADGETLDLIRLHDKRVVERHTRPYRIHDVIAGRVSRFRDVTARLLLEEELRQSQKMEAVGRLAGGVAHDFNNMLTVISLRGELLRQIAGDDESLQEEVTEIILAAERATGLTRQLLAFSRRQVLQLVSLDLNELATQMEPMLRRLIGEGIEIATIVSGTTASVRADRTQMEQVLLNLTVNARDVLLHGGRIAIEICSVALAADSAVVQGGHCSAGDHVILAVTDNGPGIADDVLGHIFEPFFTTKEVGVGTGLGLATVHRIVEQMGGYIEIESRMGEGTTFRLYFPFAQTLDGPSPAVLAPPVSLRGAETILLVEDELAVRTLARRVLSQRGYTVLAARHGRDALRLVADFPTRIDLVVTDLVMPEMGGLELVATLRRQRTDLPVLLMSGYTDEELELSSIGGGDTGFLQKPFNGTALALAVRNLLDRRATVLGVA